LYNNLYVVYDLWREDMKRAERAAELERMLPRSERRRFQGLHLRLPSLRRRTRLAPRHGC
jgi:hypothetical protein